MQFLSFILLICLAISPAFGGPNAVHAVSKVQGLGSSIDTLQSSLDGYQGGILKGYPLFRAIYDAHRLAEEARMHLGESDPFDHEEGLEVLAAYREMVPRISQALEVGAAKAHLFRHTGVIYVARSVLSNLYAEKNMIRDHLKVVLSEEHYRQAEEPLLKLDRDFQTALKAMSG